MLEATVWGYTRNGWPVLPLKGKLPITEHGVKDATTEYDKAAVHWLGDPNLNIGVAAGEPAGFFVVDIDPRNGGDREWDSLTAVHGVPVTLTARTGGGGQHLLFKLPDGPPVKNGAIGEGIDIKSTGGYIVVAPSMHESGNRYEWENDLDPQPAPQWILDLVPRKRERPEIINGGLPFGDPNDDRPGSVFNRTASWGEILEPHGWWVHDVGQDGEMRWTRPGKDGGISATTGWDGLDIFYCFTSSTAFEAETGYSKFAAYTILNHDGDFSAAGKELASVDTGGAGPTLFDRPSSGTPAYTWEPALPDNHIISKYVDWCYQQTDAPREYHEAVALALLAVVGHKSRGMLATYPGGLNPNLYVLLTGGTTRYRKSTSQKLGLSVLYQVYGSAPLPSRATTEALINHLSNKDGVPTVWMPDEFGIKLAEIYQRDFLKGMEELLLTLYDCEPYTYIKVDRTIEIRRPSLNVIAAATPESLAMAGPGAMVGGLLPRFAVVLPPAAPPARTVSEYKDLSAQKKVIEAEFKDILQWTAAHTKIHFEMDALRVLADAERNLHTGGTAVVRLATMLYKVSMLIAVGRKSETVSENDARSAVAVVRRWADGARRLQPFLKKRSSELEFEARATEALNILSKLGGRATRTDIASRLRMQKASLDALQSALVDWGEVRVEVDGETKAAVWVRT